MHLVRGSTQHPPSAHAPSVTLLERVHHVFLHVMLRTNYDGAKRNEVRVLSAAVIHGHTEEAGGQEAGCEGAREGQGHREKGGPEKGRQTRPQEVMVQGAAFQAAPVFSDP